MLTHPTLDQMQALGLAGMATAYRELAAQNSSSDLSRDEWLGLMLDRETALRSDKRLTNRLSASKLRFPDACIENIDFAAHRGLDRRNTLSLAQGAWLKAHENMIITGPVPSGERAASQLYEALLTVTIASEAAEGPANPTRRLIPMNRRSGRRSSFSTLNSNGF